MSTTRAVSPSEVHWRIYVKVIEPLQQLEAQHIVDEYCSNMLVDLLCAIDLTSHPQTFGPDDDDSLRGLGVAVSRISDKLWLDTYSGEEGRDIIRKVYADMKKAEAMAIHPAIEDSIGQWTTASYAYCRSTASLLCSTIVSSPYCPCYPRRKVASSGHWSANSHFAAVRASIRTLPCWTYRHG